MRRLLVLVPALLSAACASVHQQSHTGFHFEGTVGIVGSSSSSDLHQSGYGDHMDGTGVEYSAAAGGAVIPNLIIAGQFWGVGVPDPHISGVDGSATATNASYTVVGVGPMVKYYFMPANFYLSATPSFTRVAFTDQYDHTGTTEWGFGLRAAVGKEWYIAERWGMGIAGVLHTASNDEGGGVPAHWSTLGGGVLFTASFR
jgi:hypothetical protein